MSKATALLAVVLIAALPWIAWSALRGVWLRWKERRVLADKFGDLEMFSRRLEEWGIPTSNRSDGDRAR